MRREKEGNRGCEHLRDWERGRDDGGGGCERETAEGGVREVDRERHGGSFDGVHVLRIEVEGETLRVRARRGRDVDLKNDLLLEQVALGAVVVRVAALRLVALQTELALDGKANLALSVRLEGVLPKHPVRVANQQLHDSQQHALHLLISPSNNPHVVRPPVATLARIAVPLRLVLLHGRRRLAVRSLPPLQHVPDVILEELVEVRGGVATDAVDEGVQPEGVTVLRQELVLQLDENAERVVDGVGFEELREGDLPHLQAGTSQLRRELGLARDGLRGVESLVTHAVEQVRHQRQHAVEKRHVAQPLYVKGGARRHLSLEEALQVERRHFEGAEVRQIQRQQREEAVEIEEVVRRLLHLVLLAHELAVREGQRSYSHDGVELELENDGRGVQSDVWRWRRLLAVVYGKTSDESGSEQRRSDLDEEVRQVQVPVEGELLLPALRVVLVDARQLGQDLVKRVRRGKHAGLEKGVEEECGLLLYC